MAISEDFLERVDPPGPQKKRIRNIIRRILENGGGAVDDVHPVEEVRDIYRKLMSYTWSDQELNFLERQVLEAMKRNR